MNIYFGSFKGRSTAPNWDKARIPLVAKDWFHIDDIEIILIIDVLSPIPM